MVGTTPIWHLAKSDQKIGVFTQQQLIEMGLQGRITSDMTLWKIGMTHWQSVSKFKGLKVISIPEQPPPLPLTQNESVGSTVASKTRLICGVLTAGLFVVGFIIGFFAAIGVQFGLLDMNVALRLGTIGSGFVTIAIMLVTVLIFLDQR